MSVGVVFHTKHFEIVRVMACSVRQILLGFFPPMPVILLHIAKNQKLFSYRDETMQDEFRIYVDELSIY